MAPSSSPSTSSPSSSPLLLILLILLISSSLVSAIFVDDFYAVGNNFINTEGGPNVSVIMFRKSDLSNSAIGFPPCTTGPITCSSPTGPVNYVEEVLVGSDLRVYFSGSFTSMFIAGTGSLPAFYLAYFSTSTETWHTPLVGDPLTAGGVVYSMASNPSTGDIYLGGQFSQWQGLSAYGLVQLDPFTELWTIVTHTFSPSTVYWIGFFAGIPPPGTGMRAALVDSLGIAHMTSIGSFLQPVQSLQTGFGTATDLKKCAQHDPSNITKWICGLGGVGSIDQDGLPVPFLPSAEVIYDVGISDGTTPGSHFWVSATNSFDFVLKENGGPGILPTGTSPSALAEILPLFSGEAFVGSLNSAGIGSLSIWLAQQENSTLPATFTALGDTSLFRGGSVNTIIAGNFYQPPPPSSSPSMTSSFSASSSASPTFSLSQSFTPSLSLSRSTSITSSVSVSFTPSNSVTPSGSWSLGTSPSNSGSVSFMTTPSASSSPSVSTSRALRGSFRSIPISNPSSSSSRRRPRPSSKKDKKKKEKKNKKKQETEINLEDKFFKCASSSRSSLLVCELGRRDREDAVIRMELFTLRELEVEEREGKTVVKKIVRSYPLLSGELDRDKFSSKTMTFRSKLPNGAEVVNRFEFIKEDEEKDFFGMKVQLFEDTCKWSLKIQDWKFKDRSNLLEVVVGINPRIEGQSFFDRDDVESDISTEDQVKTFEFSVVTENDKKYQDDDINDNDNDDEKDEENDRKKKKKKKEATFQMKCELRGNVDGDIVRVGVDLDTENRTISYVFPSFERELNYDPSFALLLGAPLGFGRSEGWRWVDIATLTAGATAITIILLVLFLDFHSTRFYAYVRAHHAASIHQTIARVQEKLESQR